MLVLRLAVSAYPFHSVAMAHRPRPMVLGRAGAHRAVAAAAAATVLLTATVAAALATVAGVVLPQAAQHQLDRAPGTVIALSGAVTARSAAPATAQVRAALRAGLGGVPFTLDSALWSDPVPLPVPAQRPGPGAGTTAPARRAAAGPVREIQAAVLGGVQSRAVLAAGHWPGPWRPGAPVPAALPVAAAGPLHLAPGDGLTLRDVLSGRVVRVRITGLFRPRDPAAAYWRLDLLGGGGQATVSRFTTYGPLLVPAAAFRHGLTVAAGSWAAVAQLRRIPGPDLDHVAAALSAQLQALQDPAGPLGGLQVATRLPAALRGTAAAVVVARSLLAIGALQILLLAGAALAAAARLLAGQREAELALLAARGTSGWQLARIALAEAGPLAGLAAAAGALASGPVAAALARSGPLRAAGLPAPGVPAAAWLAAGAVAALAAGILLLPAVWPPLPGLARQRGGGGGGGWCGGGGGGGGGR
jgi:hypothetical protein